MFPLWPPLVLAAVASYVGAVSLALRETSAGIAALVLIAADGAYRRGWRRAGRMAPAVLLAL